MNIDFKYHRKGLKTKSSGMVTLTSLLTFILFSCKSSLEVEVKKGADLPSASAQLSTSTKSGSETAKDPMATPIPPEKPPEAVKTPELKPEFTGLDRLAARAGDTVKISGKNLDTQKDLEISIGAVRIPLSINPDGTAEFKMPEGISPGMGDIKLVSKTLGDLGQATMLADPGDFPISTMAVDEVCKDKKYRNAKGEITVGTKDCGSLPLCSANGQVGCATSSTFMSVSTTELVPAVVKSGTIVGGVTGTYPSATNPLTGADATADLDAATFATKIKSAGTFEFFGPDGTRYMFSGDPDLAGTNILSGIEIFGTTGTITAAPAICTTNNVSGCVTTATYRSADWTNLTAANIKNGVSIAGLTGTYPSTGNRLVNNTSTTDLASFGPATPVGTYEFFDSAGSVYGATVADGGTVTPTTSNQTISTAGTLYRSVIVQGDANLTTANIKDTVPLFGVTGSLTGAPANCSTNGQQNCLATATFFGATQCSADSSNCYVPTYAATTQPLKAISYDAIDAGKSSIHSSLTLSGIAGTLADCTTNNTSGCVTTASYRSADWTNLTAANIKNGASVVGLTGTYPSASNRLVSNTATADLTAFGPATPVGAYEFFDSAGDVYPATVADGGTITPSTSTQSLNTAGTMYRAATISGDADLVAGNILSGANLFGVNGSVTATPANCSSNGTQSCVATGSYYAATACAADGSNCFVPTYAVTTQPLKAISYDAIDAGKSSIRTSLTLSGIAGTLADCAAGGTAGCVTTATYKSLDLSNVGAASSTGVTAANFNTKIATSGNFEFWDASGARHQVAGDTDLTASNVKSSIDIFGTVGNVTPSPANCGSNGTQSCVATGSYYAATACAADGSNCFVPTYAASTQPLKAISYDAIDAGKSSIRSSLTLSGIAGTLADCSTNNAAGCVTTAPYNSADWTNLTAANIKNGASVAGLTGTYPSSGNLLTGANATADLDTGTFNAKIKSATAFEYFGPDGTRYTGAGDVDITAGNILGAVDIFGTTGSVTASPANCSSNGTQSCVATGSYYAATACAADGSNCFVPTYAATTQPLKAISYDAIDAGKSSIRTSLTLSGIAGTLADCAAGGTAGCVTTATYKSLDLSNVGAASSTGVTAANFDTKIAASGNFEFWDASGARHQVAGDTDLTASNVKSSIDIFGTVGSVTPSPANCSSNGGQSCVATGSYYAATACAADGSNCFVPTYAATTQPLKAISYDAIDAGKSSIRSSLTLSGIAGTLADCAAGGITGCVTTATYKSLDLSNVGAASSTGVTSANFDTKIAASGNFEFWDASGARHQVAGDTDLTASNVKSAIDIFGTVGSVTPSPANCASNGGQSCVAKGSYYAATACTADGSNCFVPTYAATTQPLKAISYDAIDAGKSSIRSSLTLSGITGTLADCTTNNTSGCVTTASYKSADWTNLTAANIKNGASVAGLTGTYPSSGNVLTGANATADLDLATFDAKIKSATAFEFFGPDGTRYSNSGDADITAANIASGVTIFGTTGTATTLTQCTSGVQATCESDTACRWNTGACEINPWHIRAGITVASKAGSLKANCRNTVNNTYYNWDGSVASLINSGSTAGTAYDFWDTIDDYYGYGPNKVTAWSSNTQCDSSNWTDVTTTNGGSSFTTCGTSSTCIYRDELSGLRVKGILSSGNNTTNTASPATYTWSAAINACNGSTYGGYGAGTWRLPTQKELMSLYEHGIVSRVAAGFHTLGNLQDYYWSSSGRSISTGNGWAVYLSYGTTYNHPKTNGYWVLCVF